MNFDDGAINSAVIKVDDGEVWGEIIDRLDGTYKLSLWKYTCSTRLSHKFFTRVGSFSELKSIAKNKGIGDWH